MAQMEFPFVCDDAELKAFLTRWLALEAEEDRVREEKRACKEIYADHIPLRGVLTAVKVVRARRKLELHPKEPMKREHQTTLEDTVAAYLTQCDAEMAELMESADGH